jgi:hypothetical protein
LSTLLLKTIHKFVSFPCIYDRNQNLIGAKWQSGIKHIKKFYSPDLICVCGSDDFISKKLLLWILKQKEQDRKIEKTLGIPAPAVYACKEWIMIVRSKTENNFLGIFKCCYNLDVFNQPLGSGRFYTKKFLENNEYLIFDGRKDKNLDNHSWWLLTQTKQQVRFFSLTEGIIFSLKGDWNQINISSEILASPTIDAAEFTFEGFHKIKTSYSTNITKNLFSEAEKKAK